MAYMRGEYYVYEGGDGINIYAKGGSVTIPSAIFNALVMMRVAELTEKEKKIAIKLAVVEYSGNFGVDPLRHACGLETVFEAMKKAFKKYDGKKIKVKAKNVRR